ncbi:hypothetical protein [Wolbachia endosymbiont of Dactylopius coccus]
MGFPTSYRRGTNKQRDDGCQGVIKVTPSPVIPVPRHWDLFFRHPAAC